MSQGEQGGGDSSGNGLWHAILAGLMVIGMVWVAWQTGHESISGAVMQFKLAELWCVGLVTHSLDPVRAGIARMNPADVTFDDLLAMSRAVGSVLRWFVGVLFLGMAFWAFMFAPSIRWQRVHTLESLIDFQSKVWKVITPIVNDNPSKKTRGPGEPMPDTLERWAEALLPEEWIAFYRIGVENRKLNRSAARTEFDKQLGARWRGIGHMPRHVQGLVAAFALQGARRRSECREWLGTLSVWWTGRPEGRWKGFVYDQKVKFWNRRLDHYLADEKLMKPALAIMQKHGFESTAMLGLLSWSWERGGVLASAWFLWLKPKDRRLWYPLNTLGGQAFSAEAAGVMAHFRSETLEERAIRRPRTDAAVDSLQSYLDKTQAKIPTLASEMTNGTV